MGKQQVRGKMLCFACGRMLTNDDREPNLAHWTLYEPRLPYCADSDACMRDTTESWYDMGGGVPL